MEDAIILEALVGLLLLVVLVLVFALRYVVANLYMHVRQERDMLASNRDEWRGVAERALLMATVNQSLAKRATALATLPEHMVQPDEISP